MDQYLDFSGITANEEHAKNAGVSFGEHFSERSPNIEELLLQSQTPISATHTASVQCGSLLPYFFF